MLWILNIPLILRKTKEIICCRREVSTSLGNKLTINELRLSILLRIMEIEEGVTTSTDNTLADLHNSLCDTKAEFNNCFIIHSK